MNAKALIELLHKGQKRKNGDPYTSHPYAVRDILIKEGVTGKTILDAALLHDILEDNLHISKEYLSHKFGEKVTHLVNLVSKEPMWKTPYCKMKSNLNEIESVWIDHPEVVLIKMADRLHNLQTIDGFSKKKQKEYLWETKELLIPFFEKILQKNRVGSSKKCVKSLLRKLSKEVQNIEHHLLFTFNNGNQYSRNQRITLSPSH